MKIKDFAVKFFFIYSVIIIFIVKFLISYNPLLETFKTVSDIFSFLFIVSVLTSMLVYYHRNSVLNSVLNAAIFLTGFAGISSTFFHHNIQSHFMFYITALASLVISILACSYKDELFQSFTLAYFSLALLSFTSLFKGSIMFQAVFCTIIYIVISLVIKYYNKTLYYISGIKVVVPWILLQMVIFAELKLLFLFLLIAQIIFVYFYYEYISDLSSSICDFLANTRTSFVALLVESAKKLYNLIPEFNYSSSLNSFTIKYNHTKSALKSLSGYLFPAFTVGALLAVFAYLKYFRSN